MFPLCCIFSISESTSAVSTIMITPQTNAIPRPLQPRCPQKKPPQPKKVTKAMIALREKKLMPWMSAMSCASTEKSASGVSVSPSPAMLMMN